MNTRKRWFSLVLCLVLCLGLLPGTVWAETKDRGTPEKCFADNQFNFPEEASTNMASNNNFCEENDSRAQCGSCYVEDPYESSRVESQDNLNFAMLLSSDDNIMIHKGIDVSAHQGTIDWDKVATQIEFAILRCGYGRDRTSQDDKYWAVNVAACQRLGIPFGVYLYSYAESDEQAASEAEHVLRLLEGVHPNLPVYLDLEDEETVGTLSNADILRHATTFCNAMLEHGYTPGVYANKYWWTTHLTDSAYDQWSRWIAQVGVSQPTYNKSYDIWQYSFKGPVSGITGDVDLDYYYGALEPPHPVPPKWSITSLPARLVGVVCQPLHPSPPIRARPTMETSVSRAAQ